MFNRIATAALAVGLSLSAVTAAATESAPIFKAPIGSHEASKSKRFVINPELGRAWVEINVWHDPSELNEFHRVQVPGLSYDREAAQVVFDAEGQSVVCATVRDEGFWIFKHQRIVPTGDCELTRKYVKVPVDNGFGIEVVEHFEVHFKPVSRVGIVEPATDKQG